MDEKIWEEIEESRPIVIGLLSVCFALADTVSGRLQDRSSSRKTTPASDYIVAAENLFAIWHERYRYNTNRID